MRLFRYLVVGTLFVLLGRAAQGRAQEATPPSTADVAHRYGFDPSSSLESRVRTTPATILKQFDQPGTTAPTLHTLTPEEQRTLAAAFAALPPLQRQILQARLRSISFLDGMPNTGLTSQVNPNEPYQVFDIVIRAGVLHQTASEWLTEKEWTIFDTAPSSYSVSIDAGKRDAFTYVLLHEATHATDISMGITPPLPTPDGRQSDAAQYPFTKDVWNTYTTPAPAHRIPLRERIGWYRFSSKKLALDEAPALYESLRQTPFVSLYGNSNWMDDLAEYATVYHWTTRLKQPFRIVLRKDGKEILAYEPMKSPLVRTRIEQMAQFYEKKS